MRNNNPTKSFITTKDCEKEWKVRVYVCSTIRRTGSSRLGNEVIAMLNAAKFESILSVYTLYLP